MLRIKGIAMIIFGSILWGISGTIIEWILEHHHLSIPFLLTIRLTSAGFFLLVFLFFKKNDIFSVWKTPSSSFQMMMFSLIGMLGVQFAFFATIEESNAVVATLLQFSAPIFIAVYVALKSRTFPPRYQIIGIAGTLAGLFLLLTNGAADHLLVSPKALFWGICLGLAYAFYTLYPDELMKERSVLTIVGWAMLISGIFVGVVTQIWNSDEWQLLAQMDVTLPISLLALFSTMGFALFLSSLKYISAVEASVLSSIEPLSVMVISVIWFGTILQSFQLLGVSLMLIFVTWLSIGGRKTSLRKGKAAAVKTTNT